MPNLTAVIGADTSKFVEEVKSAKYMLNKFINETKTQSNTIKKNTQVTNEQIQSYQRVIKSLEKVGSGTMTAKQQQAALTNQIKDLKIQWANLSETAKNGDFGKSLASTLTTAQDKLKTITTQISQTNTEMQKLNKNTKNLDSINQFFGKFSNNLTMSAGAMSTLGINGGQALSTVATKSSFIAGLGPTLANPYVLAGAAIAGAGVAWYKYNKEFDETIRLTKEFTGLEGPALESLRNGIKAVSDVWKKDYRTVLEAVDNLMVQFHIDGETALSIIKDGFVAGADDAGRMLDLIKQYSGSFKDAGISASELVAIIGNTRSGIFSEEGMAVIEMAAKNIRNMKDKTIESLNAIGISADDMKAKLQNGTMTTMEALQEISKKLKEFPPQSQEVGEVLQDVFGKKGSSAGYELVTALGDIQTNLGEVKKQTGDFGKSLEDLADADKRLEEALSQTFGIADGGFDTLSNKAKTEFYEALIWVINGVNELKESFQTWYAYTKAAIDQICYSVNELAAALESLADFDFSAVGDHISNAFSADKFNGEIDAFYDNLHKKDNKFTNQSTSNTKTRKQALEDERKELQHFINAYEKVYKDDPYAIKYIPKIYKENTDKYNASKKRIREIDAELNPTTPKTKGGGNKGGGNKGGGSHSPSKTTPKVEYQEGSLGFIEQQISKKQSELKLAINDADRQRIQKEIDELTGQKKAIELSLKPKLPEGSLGFIEQQISKKQAELKLAINDVDRQRIQKEIDDLAGQKKAIELSLKPKLPEGSLDELNDKIKQKQVELNAAIDDASRLKIQKEIDELTGQKNVIELKLKPVVSDKDISKLDETLASHANPSPVSATPGKKSSNVDQLKDEYNFNEQIVKSYKEQYNLIQQKIAAGGTLTTNEQKLVSVYEDATKQVEELGKAYTNAANAAEKLRLKSEIKKKTWQGIKSGIGTLGDLNGAVMNTKDTWQSLGEQWNDMSAFDKVTSAFDATISTIETVIGAYESVSKVVQLFGEISELMSAKKVAANTAEMTSDQTKMAMETANTQTKLANDTAENTSELGKLGVKEAGAIASATSSGASLPFPANIAAIAAGIAAVVAAFAMVFSCFAEGGIVGGNTTIGDYNLARVNKGEMILNGTQQKRLFNLLNTDGNYDRIKDPKGNVTFTIKGQKLQGVLRNYNSKRSRV